MRKAWGVLALLGLLVAGRAEAATCGGFPFILTNGTLADASQVMANFNSLLTCANSSLAPLASPAFTGIPTAPTAGASTNTTQIATTAFVQTIAANFNVNVAFPASFGLTPTSQWSVNIGAFPIGGEAPAGVMQGIKSAMVVPSTYTQAPWPNSNFAAYMNNLNNFAPGNAAMNFFGVASAGVNNASAWNFNTIIGNTFPATGGASAGSGFDFGVLIGLELNFNVFKKGGSQPQGQVIGIKMLGGGETGVSPVAAAYAIDIFGLTLTTAPWTTAIRLEPASATLAMDIGQLATGSTQSSMGIFFRATNSLGVLQTAFIQEGPAGNLILGAALTQTAIFVATSSYNFSATTFASQDAVGDTTNIFDFAGNIAILLGGAPGSAINSYRNTTHSFQSIAGAATYSAFVAIGGLATTSFELQVNNNAGANLANVTLGATDGGGAGFRVLRVPN